jgi:hypothetical protein
MQVVDYDFLMRLGTSNRYDMDFRYYLYVLTVRMVAFGCFSGCVLPLYCRLVNKV